MYKRYSNSLETRYLKEQSIIMFREVSSGVYHVEKDREEVLVREFVEAEQVVLALRHIEKVAVIGSHGAYANFEIEKRLS